MVTARLRSAFFDRPEFLLALSLSAPNEIAPRDPRSVTVDFTDDDVSVRVKRREARAVGPRIVATKQTIAAAILLHHVVTERGPDYASSLIERAQTLARESARADAEEDAKIALGLGPGAPLAGVHALGYLQQLLEVSERDFDIAQRITLDAFDFLEAENLVIDPAFVPGMMVLLGLLPMHFSVRTQKGERVYREIKINAPLWSANFTKGLKKGRQFTDVEFKVRGIEIVRRAITAIATQYLESEGHIRENAGHPVLKRNAPPELDVD
jgi:hypothetical protein